MSVDELEVVGKPIYNVTRSEFWLICQPFEKTVCFPCFPLGKIQTDWQGYFLLVEKHSAVRFFQNESLSYKITIGLSLKTSLLDVKWWFVHD